MRRCEPPERKTFSGLTGCVRSVRIAPVRVDLSDGGVCVKSGRFGESKRTTATNMEDNVSDACLDLTQRLSRAHLEMLRRGSAISDEVIAARGYRTTTDPAPRSPSAGPTRRAPSMKGASAPMRGSSRGAPRKGRSNSVRGRRGAPRPSSAFPGKKYGDEKEVRR